MDATTNPARQRYDQWVAQYEAILEKHRIYYRGFTIEPTQNGCPYGGYDYYPTEEGRDDDADFDGESYRYCGNVQFAHSIEAAKREIDDIIYEKMHVVTLNEGDPVYEHRYEFEKFEDALGFALQWGGTFYPNGLPILNP